MINNFFKFRHGAIFVSKVEKLNKKKNFKLENNTNHKLISTRGLALRYAKRLDEGHEFYCFFKKKKIIAYYWLSEKKAPLAFNNNIVFPKKYIYIWGCYVSKNYRRKGLYKKMLREAKDIAKKKGKKNLLISSNISNNISTQTILKCGFQKLKEYKFYKILWLKIVFTNNSFRKL